MIQINKKYLLVYQGDKAIVLSKSEKLPYSLGLPSDKLYKEEDDKEAIEADIKELGIVLTEDQQTELDNFKD